MRRVKVLGTVLLLLAASGRAATAADAEPEALSAWEWYQDVAWDAVKSPRQVDFVLPPSVFDKSREDLGDLRLYDANHRAVPYALRVRRERDEQVPLTAREFNRAAHPDRSVELSLDLGDAPGEHNEIRVLMPGKNVRRRLHLEGSNDDKQWNTLLDKVDWMAFRAGGQKIDVHTFRYPASRFRYLRVQVRPDRSLEEDKPALQAVTVLRSIQQPAKNITLPANLGPREPVPADDAPGSAWFLDFGGDRVLCERLSFDIGDPEFVRPYRLEMALGDGGFRPLARGEWRRQRGEKPAPLGITFNEVHARRLRLIVTDHRNAPLNIQSARYTAPARQVIFAPPAELTPPMRLYFGNPDAAAPHYDFAETLPAVLEPPPLRGSLNELTRNPEYQPPPRPWSERWPWLVYVVLSAASLALLGILGLLGREAIARRDGAPAGSSAPS
jgi:hypothetical protein